MAQGCTSNGSSVRSVAGKNNLHEDTLKNNINKYTKRRHVIAHNGDYAKNQTPFKELEIDKKFAQDCLKLISNFTKTLDDICFKK